MTSNRSTVNFHESSTVASQSNDTNIPENVTDVFTLIPLKSALLDVSPDRNHTLDTLWNHDNTVHFLSIAICVIGSITAFCNLVVLLASKFASGGRAPTLVFIRSLCVGDGLIGVYGAAKMVMIVNMDDLMINCFLPESIFITASTATIFSILWLNIDCCLKIVRPLDYNYHMDKRNVIAIMVILWNAAFIIGFLPQMGWHHTDYVCVFFEYYSHVYLWFIGILWKIGTLATCGIQIYLYRVLHRITLNHHFLSPMSYEYKKCRRLIITVRIDLISWILCYIPLSLFLMLCCEKCLVSKQYFTDIHMLYFLPTIILRSGLCALIHGYRTSQIHVVVRGLSRKFSKIVTKNNHSTQTSCRRSDLTSISTQTSGYKKTPLIRHKPKRNVNCSQKSLSIRGIDNLGIDFMTSSTIETDIDGDRVNDILECTSL